MIPNLPVNCCGCEVCAAVCPRQAISFSRNAEGFYFPLINETICVQCGECLRNCPVLNYKNIVNLQNIKCFGGYFKDQLKLCKSSSGGFATALGESFIKSKGIVYGTVYSTNPKSAFFSRAETLDDLYKFRGSKYSQVRKGNVFHDVIFDLENGKRVLFFGLPCEVVALKHIVKNKYFDNLYTCDLICHGVTSERVLEEYVSYIESVMNKKAVSLNMRYKKIGSRKPHFKIDFEDKSSFIKELYETEYGRAFQVLKRPSCNNCYFKGQKRYSDMTIGDFHAVTVNSPVYCSNGVSSIIVHSERGLRLILDSNFDDFIYQEIPINEALNNRAYSESIPSMLNRRTFVKLLLSKGLIYAANSRSTLFYEKQRKFRNRIIAYRRALFTVLKRINK